MTPNHFEGQMKGRVEKPVLTPIQRLRKIKADRIELERLKALDRQANKKSVDNLIDLVNSLLPE